jgi:spartin
MFQSEAFILLNLENAMLKTGNVTYDGILALECVTISVTQAQITETPARDVYLVLRIKSFETPLDPSGAVKCSIQNGFRHYSFLGGGGENVVVTLHEPGAHEPHVKEDLDTFDSILAQYTEFRSPQPHLTSPPGSEKPEDLRGHVVLVNEDNGEIVGELDNKLIIQEDPTLDDKSQEKGPVVIEIPEEGQNGARAALVRAIPPGEQDMLIKGASLVRYGILYFWIFDLAPSN